MDSKFIEDITRALKNKDIELAASIAHKYLKDLNSIPLNIGVTGESGSGKSSFVNAFRGIDQEDERAAPTGVVETTMEPKPYPHPQYPNVTLWDLPGIGTSNFKADQYLKQVQFDKFDFFIIISAGRFRENDAKLAQEIKKMGKSFYFVRAKIDNDLRAEKTKREYNQENTLKKIREDCIQGLKKQGVTSPQVFLVSHFDLHLYDFPTLLETMEGDLPSHKRHVLTLVLLNICTSNIQKKKEVFRSQIKFYALTSAAIAVVPIPGLSIAADLGTMVVVIREYLFGFGLDKKSLEKLSKDNNHPLDDLKEVLKYMCSGKEITKELVSFMLRSMTITAICVAAEEVLRWFPGVGSLVAAGLSFGTISIFLSYVLDNLAVDAENVLKKALDLQ